MSITRNSNQKSQTLEEFYLELTKEDNKITTVNIGNAMLLFIDMINQTFKETQIWGLTSHYRLVIQAKDDWKSDWYIIVNCIGNNEYYFEYLMPADKRPWEHATVRGVARSITEAKKYLLISMNECGGWSGNSELNDLIKMN